MNRTAGAILVLAGLALLPALAAAQAGVLLREEFNDLAAWRPVTFPKIREHTRYSIEHQERESVLRAESRASASAIVYRSPFSVYDYPRLRWKWKVENVYEKGNARVKEGDDYPLRVYVLFEYDPSTASAFDRAKYGLAKALYGEYPPHSALNYIWASREDEGGHPHEPLRVEREDDRPAEREEEPRAVDRGGAQHSRRLPQGLRDRPAGQGDPRDHERFGQHAGGVGRLRGVHRGLSVTAARDGRGHEGNPSGGRLPRRLAALIEPRA